MSTARRAPKRSAAFSADYAEADVFDVISGSASDEAALMAGSEATGSDASLSEESDSEHEATGTTTSTLHDTCINTVYASIMQA